MFGAMIIGAMIIGGTAMAICKLKIRDSFPKQGPNLGPPNMCIYIYIYLHI